MPSAAALPRLLAVLAAAAAVAAAAVGPAAARAEPGVVFAATVFRHGDRTPIVFYPKDEQNAESTWNPVGKGLLTLKGMQQHFEVGRSLRNRPGWKALLANEEGRFVYDRRDVHVRSTDVDRTLMSAQSQLAGLYSGYEDADNTTYPQPPWALAWRPVPVHTVALENEWLMRSYSNGVCPEYAELQKDWTKSKEYTDKAAEYAGLFDELTEATGMKVTMENFMLTFDNMVCQLSHNRTVLPAVLRLKDRMQPLEDWWARTEFQGPRRKVTGGFLLQRITTLLTQKAQSPPQEWESGGNKLRMFSAHDTTLLALQSALGMDIAGNPPYASLFVFELLDTGAVRMQFIPGGVGEPQPVDLDGCEHECPIARFVELVKPVFPGDEETACGNTASGNKPDDSGVSVFLVFVVLVVVALTLTTAATVLLRWNRRREAASRPSQWASLEDGDGEEELVGVRAGL